MESLFKTHDQDELLVQSNALIHSRQTFTLLQQRILALAVQQIDRGDDPKTEYRIAIQDLVDFSGSKNIYNQLEEETRKLAGKVVTRKGVTDEGKRFFQHWAMIKKAEHIEDSGELIIQFHSEIAEQLFALKGNFGPSVAIEKASCHSVFGARIYEILLDYWQHGEVEFSVKDLKFMLGVDGKYKSFTQFRNHVLSRAQKDLKKHTQLRFTWKEEKRAKGRGKAKKITHVKFDFSWQPNQMGLALNAPQKPNFRELPYNLLERLKTNIGLSGKQIETVRRWIQDRPKQDYPLSVWINKNLEVPNPVDSAGKPIRSKQKYFIHHFENEFKKTGFPEAAKPKSNAGFAPLIEE
jgi:hypothetical protein